MLVGKEPAYNVGTDTVDTKMTWTEAKRTMTEDRRQDVNPLWKHMMNVGIAADTSPQQLYFTNLAKCNADGASFDDCVEHCRGYLPREIGEVDPKVLLLHGSKVINVVLDMFDISWSGSVGDVHGEIFETSSLQLVTLYHWGYAYRQGDIDQYNETVRNTVTEALS